MNRKEKFSLLYYTALCLLVGFYILVMYYGYYLEMRVSDSANGISAILVFLPGLVMMMNIILLYLTKNKDTKLALTVCIALSAVALAAGDAIAVMWFSTELSLFRIMEMCVFLVFTINSAIVQTLGLRWINSERA